jgi:hypothetical protein
MTTAPFPNLRTLHARHRGLTEAVCHAYAEAAHVCLSRHHQPPIEIMIAEQGFISEWDVPGDRARRAWANLVDAVEAGAYAMAIAAVEATHEWFAISRAETLSGADYYVGPAGAELETAYRLEVSGVDTGDVAVLRARLSRKVRQTRAARSSAPALACVVGFQIRSILVSDLERPQ